MRGQQVTDTGAPITIPVGDETLGRIINVIGDPIDERGPVVTDKYVFILALRQIAEVCSGQLPRDF